MGKMGQKNVTKYWHLKITHSVENAMLQIHQHNFQPLRVCFVTLACLKSLREKKSKREAHRTTYIKTQSSQGDTFSSHI